MKIMAVVLTLLLAVSLAFATHLDSVSDNDGMSTDDNTITTADTSGLDCRDVNPYDSIDQCGEGTSGRMLTSDTWVSSDIETTSDGGWILLRCRAGDDVDTWECQVVEQTEATSDRILTSDLSRTGVATRSTGTTWSDTYDYNNPNRVTTDTGDDDMTVEEDTETTGFESPVVYRNNLNTDRTSAEQAD